MPESEPPYVEATLTFRLPCPESATEEEALDVAREEFADVRKSERADLQLRYLTADDQEGSRGPADLGEFEEFGDT